MADYLKYYSRRDVQKRIAGTAKDREVGIRYREQFGKRPDIIQYPGDVLDAARKGATSFHISEERWSNPLELAGSLGRVKLDELRTGFDIIIDIDTPYWEYAKKTAYLVAEALKFHDVNCFCMKFSGGKGFHIGIPFEALPENVNNIPIKRLFPETPRAIALYLKDMIRERLAEEIKGGISTAEDMLAITKKAGKSWDELRKDGRFDPFALLDIDIVLISSRHMFRSPYSLHEKSGLVSLPIKADKILNFEKENASIDNIDCGLGFLEECKVREGEARNLVMQAFDWAGKKGISGAKDESFARKEYALPEQALKEEFFPDCIKLISRGLSDGKKRALFVLLNFLRSVGWDYNAIEKFICEWNARNKEALRENYIKAQIAWHKRQAKNVLPPNCANEMYYKDLGVCTGLCVQFKNPVNAALARARKKAGK